MSDFADPGWPSPRASTLSRFPVRRELHRVGVGHHHAVLCSSKSSTVLILKKVTWARSRDATGPNYPREYVITVDIADTQSVGDPDVGTASTPTSSPRRITALRRADVAAR
jgi:hypothetical protein